MNSGNMSAMKEVEEADKKWLCSAVWNTLMRQNIREQGQAWQFSIQWRWRRSFDPYRGVGWQEKKQKSRVTGSFSIKMTYYEAFSEARKALNSEEKGWQYKRRHNITRQLWYESVKCVDLIMWSYMGMSNVWQMFREQKI